MGLNTVFGNKSQICFIPTRTASMRKYCWRIFSLTPKPISRSLTCDWNSLTKIQWNLMEVRKLILVSSGAADWLLSYTALMVQVSQISQTRGFRLRLIQRQFSKRGLAEQNRSMRSIRTRGDTKNRDSHIFLNIKNKEFRVSWDIKGERCGRGL